MNYCSLSGTENSNKWDISDRLTIDLGPRSAVQHHPFILDKVKTCTLLEIFRSMPSLFLETTQYPDTGL